PLPGRRDFVLIRRFNSPGPPTLPAYGNKFRRTRLDGNYVKGMAREACWIGGRRRPMERLLRWAFGNVVRTGNLRITTARGSSFTVGDGTGKPLAMRFTSAHAE